MSDLINDLLKLSRLSRARDPFPEREFKRNGQSIVEELKNTQPERKIEFIILPRDDSQG